MVLLQKALRRLICGREQRDLAVQTESRAAMSGIRVTAEITMHARHFVSISSSLQIINFSATVVSKSCDVAAAEVCRISMHVRYLMLKMSL